MTIPDYRYFNQSSELYHYGMPRRSGRYPWGSGERPYQGEGGFSRLDRKFSKRFDRLDRRIEKKQAEANKRYNKSIRKSTRKFQTDFSIRSARKNFIKATSAQKKVNEATYKGSQYFKKYEKLINKLNLEMDEDLKRRGTEYMNNVIFNSKSAYQVALSKKI